MQHSLIQFLTSLPNVLNNAKRIILFFSPPPYSNADIFLFLRQREVWAVGGAGAGTAGAGMAGADSGGGAATKGEEKTGAGGNNE